MTNLKVIIINIVLTFFITITISYWVISKSPPPSSAPKKLVITQQEVSEASLNRQFFSEQINASLWEFIEENQIKYETAQKLFYYGRRTAYILEKIALNTRLEGKEKKYAYQKTFNDTDKLVQALVSEKEFQNYLAIVKPVRSPLIN